ncbi:MAG: H+/Na+-translocating ferredoxin:NAD+ oxidoreductase subunit [Fusobacteriaceae bacterium]|jgi:electron transport complex protein RnfG|nr:RnfABCDGE type electron transport complex subunit [Fusobacteriales bacterium]MDN5303880.1 H+/Na+-translocating ferredoxin:NAD+ oxidoreductase subunit [Fusobacteriaceae bacterium]
MNKTLHYGLVLFIIASISASILAFINGKTAPVIAERAKSEEIEARKNVLLADEYRLEEKKEIEGMEFVPAYKNNEKVGYVVKTIGLGYGGDIVILLGVDMNGKITGINILKALETPGLGDKILNKEWQKRWIGKDKNYQFKVGVDSFAGATISPRGVYTGLMKALNAFEKEVK